MKLWKNMSQRDVDLYSISVTLGENIRLYETEAYQHEKRLIIGFFFDYQTNRVNLRFTTYDDELIGIDNYDPLLVFGYMHLQPDQALELAELLIHESKNLDERTSDTIEFRLLNDTEYTKYGIQISQFFNGGYFIQKLPTKLQRKDDFVILEIGQILFPIYERHNIYISTIQGSLSDI